MNAPLVLMLVISLGQPAEKAEAPKVLGAADAEEASDTGAEIVTESAEAPKVLGADEVKEVKESIL